MARNQAQKGAGHVCLGGRGGGGPLVQTRCSDDWSSTGSLAERRLAGGHPGGKDWTILRDRSGLPVNGNLDFLFGIFVYAGLFGQLEFWIQNVRICLVGQ